MRGRVLIVAGSDSSGGAGITADVKTVTALGGYAATAITALTAQDTLGVHAVVPVDPEFVALQMRLVLEDIGADAIKTGMLASREIVEVVAQHRRAYASRAALVVDPVMRATHGTPLLSDSGSRALVERLFPLASVVTPNIAEAEALTGVEIRSLDGMQHAADRLLLFGPEAVVIKGGHLGGERVVDLLRTADGVERRFDSPRVPSRPMHGTGCAFASAIAVGLAEGMTLEGSVDLARRYVAEAIVTAPGYGQGLGVLNHAHPVLKETLAPP